MENKPQKRHFRKNRDFFIYDACLLSSMWFIVFLSRRAPNISPVTRQSALGVIHNSVLEKNSIKNFLSLVSVSPKSRDSLFCNRFDDTISRDKSLSLIRVNLHQHSAVGNFVGNLQGATGVQ